MLQFCILTILLLPLCAFFTQTILNWSGKRLGEGFISHLMILTFGGSTVASLAAIALLASGESDYELITPGAWFTFEHYAFTWHLSADRLSLLFSLIISSLTGLIGAFSCRYLHRDPGFYRFYLLLTLFGLGAQLVSLAGNLELIFFGWELVGISSALLISYFHERQQPVYNGFRAYVTYRICDSGLIAALILYHVLYKAHTNLGYAGSYWPGLALPESAGSSTLLVLLLLFSCMGKSALFPVGGWLPRAMEGPTPSSAIFYGAISIHLGPFLLLRAHTLLENSMLGAAVVLCIGTATALYGTFVGRAQTDIKSALAFASMTQIGLIVVEISLGFYYVALAHIFGHAFLRTLQILHSPGILSDYSNLERSVGTVLPHTGMHIERFVPERMQPLLYRYALERGYVDALLIDYFIQPVVRFFRFLNSLEQKWLRFLAGNGNKGSKK